MTAHTKPDSQRWRGELLLELFLTFRVFEWIAHLWNIVSHFISHICSCIRWCIERIYCPMSCRVCLHIACILFSTIFSIDLNRFAEAADRHGKKTCARHAEDLRNSCFGFTIGAQQARFHVDVRQISRRRRTGALLSRLPQIEWRRRYPSQPH
jgi:hypothetical protein